MTVLAAFKYSLATYKKVQHTQALSPFDRRDILLYKFKWNLLYIFLCQTGIWVTFFPQEMKPL